MKIEDMKKILKENKIHFYSYWCKNKLLELLNKNNLIPEKPEEPEEPEKTPEEEVPKFVNYERLRNIRNSPIKVKLIDVETKEEKTFPSIYKASQFLDRCPQTIRHFGKRKGVWNKKYQIITE